MWSVSINQTSSSLALPRENSQSKFTFSDLLQIQKNFLEHEFPHRPIQEQNALIFAEVEPTITLGARQMLDPHEQTKWSKLKETLAEKGITISSGERGGNETWHGPGQWVGFVLTPLEQFTGDAKGVKKAVCKILNTILPVVQAYEPNAEIQEGKKLGIWTPRGKVASIGIKIRNGFVSSGFAINCYPTELSFYGIDPCGLEGAVPDFLFRDRIEAHLWPSEFQRVLESLKSAF